MYNYGNSSWTDLLTSYNGQNITYDAIGNPTSYLGYTLKWNGRQLSSLSGNGTTASYKYDADGLRSYKKVGNVETTYQYVGDKLMYEKRGTTEFYYYYNSFGNLAGIKYIQNGTEYMVYAVCNMRGDVEDLYWGSGNLACHYTYDTWGNVISVTDINGKEITNANHIGLMNPIRYRGYYFDSEIGMYYLQSRYYNPQVGRFISADDQLSTDDIIGMNLFTYCGNNPVNRLDSSGEAWYHWAIGAGIVAACAAAVVITAGGAAPAIAAVASVVNGFAAATTASTIAAGAFVGSSMVLGTAALFAVGTSSSVKEFNDQGNWGTVAATAVGTVLGGYGGYTTSKGQMKTTTGRGMQNPKVRAAAQRGQLKHKLMDYGPGVDKEVTIAPGCRVDGIDFNNRIIYELKPNNPQAIARGMSQLDRYTAAASQQYGGTWTGVLKLYD